MAEVMTDSLSDPLPFGAESQFLEDPFAFAALKTAFGIGLIDQLINRSALQPDELFEALGGDENGKGMLLGMLQDAGVLVSSEAGISLSEDFHRVLDHRRAQLESKIAFIDCALQDVLSNLTELLFDIKKFQQISQTFQLFRYDLALEITPEALRQTRKWVSYVTALTELEAPYLAPIPEFDDCARLLEVGGNSGAFAEALLDQNPDMRAVVLDLPAVCEIGRERMQGRTAAGRLTFVPGDARSTSWPRPAEIVLFKSVLHDWPDAEVRDFLFKAKEALEPGGRIVICERAPVTFEGAPMPVWMAANLVFAPFYRPAERYVKMLSDLGMERVASRTIKLDMPFNILTAIRTR